MCYLRSLHLSSALFRVFVAALVVTTSWTLPHASLGLAKRAHCFECSVLLWQDLAVVMSSALRGFGAGASLAAAAGTGDSKSAQSAKDVDAGEIEIEESDRLYCVREDCKAKAGAEVYRCDVCETTLCESCAASDGKHGFCTVSRPSASIEPAAFSRGCGWRRVELRRQGGR